jgi:tyrosyl-tRNA synthetase
LGKTTIESTEEEAAATAGGGVWLDKRRTSPYALYQYFRQLHDDEAERLLVYFSLRPMDGDDGLDALLDEHRRNLGKWVAQAELADEVTRLVHGVAGLELAKRCSRLLFGNDGSVEAEMEALPADSIRELFGPASTFHLSRHAIHTAGELADATYSDGRGGAGARKTGVGAKRMLLGGFYLNGAKRLDPAERLDSSDAHLLQGQFSLVRWGRRRYSLVEWSS